MEIELEQSDQRVARDDGIVCFPRTRGGWWDPTPVQTPYSQVWRKNIMSGT